MKRPLQIITAGLFLSGLVSAQDPRLDSIFDVKRRELLFFEMERARAGIDQELALRRQAQYLERQFFARMNRFVALWGALVNEYNEKRAFNIKLAREVGKAFHELENGEGWPKSKPGRANR